MRLTRSILGLNQVSSGLLMRGFSLLAAVVAFVACGLLDPRRLERRDAATPSDQAKVDVVPMTSS